MEEQALKLVEAGLAMGLKRKSINEAVMPKLGSILELNGVYYKVDYINTSKMRASLVFYGVKEDES